MSQLSNQNIFALATPPQMAALHLHRLTGLELIGLLKSAFYTHKKHLQLDFHALRAVSKKSPVTRYVKILDPEGHHIDDVVLTAYFAPYSYTGEDVLEITSHGNPLITTQIQRALRQYGLRDALPGEFTQRAYFNQKIDLTQAEAINDLIHAESAGALHLARKSLRGELTQALDSIFQDLVSLMAYFEAHIDFADDEVGTYDSASMLPKVQILENKLRALHASYDNGMKIRNGLKIVLCGKPNAGKSSLYNRLLKNDRAIVTDVPGTTRDILEEKLIIQDRDFVLLDTAGIRKTDNLVEKIGVERSQKHAAQADILLLVWDTTQFADDLEEKNWTSITLFLQQETEQFLSNFTFSEKKKIIFVFHKTDAITTEQTEFLNEKLREKKDNTNFFSKKYARFVGDAVLTHHNNIDELEKSLVLHFDSLTKFSEVQAHPTLISARQRDKIELCLSDLQHAINLVRHQDFPEKIASLLVSMQKTLEELIGEIPLDRVYEEVFSTFCIGK